jgi:hypothetical protein
VPLSKSYAHNNNCKKQLDKKKKNTILPNVLRETKSSILRWAALVAQMKYLRNKHFSGKPKKK